MNIGRARTWVIGYVSIVIALSACQYPNTTPVPAADVSPSDWQIYTNTNHKFSFLYPPDWEVKEVSALDETNHQEEIWFTAEDFPPPNTDARPDLTLIITIDSPLAQWEQEYFDKYQKDVIQFGNGTAVKISGVGKESLYAETVVILNLGGIHLQILPGEGVQALEAFGRLPATFESEDTPNADVRDVESVTCTAPYFDPIAFLPGNDQILLRSDSGIMIFDLKTLEEKVRLEAPMRVVKAALSPDGRTLAWALEDHRIEIIDLPSGKTLNTLTGHTDIVTAIKFSQAGDKLYTASHDDSVKVWDVYGSLASEFYPGRGDVLGIGVSSDDTRMVIVTFEGPQKLWDLKQNELIREIGFSGAFDGSDAGFSPDGRIAAISLGGGPISLWNVEDGAQLWSDGNYALALSPDGNFMAYSDVNADGKNVVFLRALEDQQSIQTLTGHPGLVWKLLFSADGTLLVSTGNEIRMWQTADGKLENVFSVECP